MNRTIKIFSAVAVCVMMLFVTACGKKDNTPFSHGTWSGNTYTSQFFGLKVETGSDWTALSDADLAKRSGISDMSESSIRSRFEKGRSVYEMMTIKNNGSSMNIVIQDSDETISWTEKDFFTAAVPLFKAQFDAQGFKSSVVKDTVNFLGKNANCLNIVLTKDNVTVYEIMIPVFKSHYTACISVGSLNKSELYTLLGMFTAL